MVDVLVDEESKRTNDLNHFTGIERGYNELCKRQHDVGLSRNVGFATVASVFSWGI
jgi:hypothetical protein